MNHDYDIRTRLAGRIYERDIRALCDTAVRDSRGRVTDALYELAGDSDDRVGYNALWALCHMPVSERSKLESRRQGLIDLLLNSSHTGRRRLLLALLEKMRPAVPDDLRGDYMDYCLSHINSNEPYGVRALCIKQAFAQCRHFPELLGELSAELEMMGLDTMPPGLAAARRNILKRIASELRSESQVAGIPETGYYI